MSSSARFVYRSVIQKPPALDVPDQDAFRKALNVILHHPVETYTGPWSLGPEQATALGALVVSATDPRMRAAWAELGEQCQAASVSVSLE